MIKMLNRGEFTCPIVQCDICHGMIGDIAEGAAVFVSVGLEDNAKGEVLHAHKDACHDRAERQLADKFCKGSVGPIGWDELGRHMLLLCNNTGINKQVFEELTEQQDRLGAAGL